MFNAAPFNSTPFNAAPSGAAKWPLVLGFVPYAATPQWPLALVVTGTVTPQWPLALDVLDLAAVTASPEHVWGRALTLAGVDWTASLEGPVEVDAEANASAIARVSLRLPAGAFDPEDWQGVEAALDYVWAAPGGAQTYTVPMIRGTVDQFSVDDARRVITLTISDRRKGLLLGADPAIIAGLLPGSLWSAGVFRADVDGLRHAEDRLSTLCADFDLDPDGAPRLTPWAAKATADWTITRVVADSLAIDYARFTDLVHRVVVDFTYRFTRLRRREARLRYTFDLLDMFNHAVNMPSSALIEEAVDGAGWEVLDRPLYTRPAEWYLHSGIYYGCDSDNGVLAATARLGKRFGQSVEEHYTLTVDCAEGGIDARLQSSLGGALEAPFDLARWEADAGLAPVLPAPGWGVESAQDATTDPDSGRAGAENALRTLLAMAVREIRGSHRQNRVRFEVPLNPFIGRAHTVELDLPGRNVVGKVQQVAHRLDFDAGQATTTVTLAISRPHLANTAADDALDPPVAPGIPALAAGVAEAHYLELGNRVGALGGSPAYDEAWSGWLINVPSENIVDGMITRWSGMTMTAAGEIYGGGQGPAFAVTYGDEPASKFDGSIANHDYVAANAYPVQFRLRPPEVEAAARDNLDVPLAAGYRVRIPEDVFNITY